MEAVKPRRRRQIAIHLVETARAGREEPAGRLPGLVLIGAMRCGTTALHGYLDDHPDIEMSRPKELNFFIGPAGAEAQAAWEEGNWHQGTEWYRDRFAGTGAVTGESSPGYTSPDHTYAAERMARIVPDALLVYLIRDPIERAISQYGLHRRDGTEHRSIEAALLDPASQYMARSRYLERLQPFLKHFSQKSIHIIEHETLRSAPGTVVRSLCRALGLDPDAWPEPLDAPPSPPEHRRRIGKKLEQQLAERLVEDALHLEAFAGLNLSGWRL